MVSMNAINSQKTIVPELTSFFELLAKFDFEDKKKCSDSNKGSLDSAPEEPLLLSVITVKKYRADENTKNKD